MTSFAGLAQKLKDKQTDPLAKRFLKPELTRYDKPLFCFKGKVDDDWCLYSEADAQIQFLYQYAVKYLNENDSLRDLVTEKINEVSRLSYQNTNLKESISIQKENNNELDKKNKELYRMVRDKTSELAIVKSKKYNKEKEVIYYQYALIGMSLFAGYFIVF